MTLNLAVISWIRHPKAQATKETIDKLDFVKMRNLCSKDMINRMKR